MKKNIFTVLLLCCLAALTAHAQNDPLDSITTVYVGGRLPKALFDLKSKALIKGKTSNYSLATDRDKLILIDFWASWCGPCIKNFPLLEKAQARFPDGLKVLMVNCAGTGDTESSLAAKVNASEGVIGQTALDYIVEDKGFLKAFPHKVVPHYVWIVDGRVAAITSEDFVTEEHIAMMVARNSKQVEAMTKFRKMREDRYKAKGRE